MSIIKEYVKQEKNNRFIIRRGDCAHTIPHIMNLYKEATKDFGFIDSLGVDIVHYGGDRYRGTFGIEFNLNRTPPDDYQQVAQVEFSL